MTYHRTLRRAGKRREADATVSAAREGFESLGATTYVRRCDRELKAGGVHAVLRDRPIDALLGIHSRTELAATRAARS